MQSYNNPKYRTNNDRFHEQQCFFETEQEQFEHQSKSHIEQSLELKAVHRMVKKHLPANQLRTVRRPNKMVARTLFKQQSFYVLPKDLELPAQETAKLGAPYQPLLIKKPITNASNINEKNVSSNFSVIQQGLSSPQPQGLIIKKIGPKLSNKEQLSISDYFSQPIFKCVYRKYKQSEKTATNGSKLSFHAAINTEKMRCIQSLADYNWKSFKQLQQQGSYSGYIKEKKQICYCSPEKRMFVSKISAQLNSNALLNFTTISYKEKDKAKMMNETQQSQQTKKAQSQEFQTPQLPQTTPLKLKIAIDSNFQCGNLCYAFVHQARPKDVYLFLQNDTNTHGYNNWFFFRMRLILQANHSQNQQISMRFHIMNMTKNSSMYKQGMLLSIFSMKKYIQNGQGWFKGGNNINLMSTGFERTNHPNQFFVSLSFEYKFQFKFNFGQGKTSDDQQIYFAMNKPYTYTRLIRYLLDYKKLSYHTHQLNEELIEEIEKESNDPNLKSDKDCSQFVRFNTNNSFCNIVVSDSQDQEKQKNIMRITDPNKQTTSALQFSQKTRSQGTFKKVEKEQAFQISPKKDCSKFFVELKNVAFTLSNNILPVITIGLGQKQQVLKRRVILFLGRQHPSQTMGSFVGQGMMNFFKVSHSSFNSFNEKSDSFPYDGQIYKFQYQSDYLLRNFQIVFVPMINPDGVIHGNSRCNFAGFDLNRRWDENSMKELTPETYHLRNLIMKLHDKNQIAFMVDLHGHGKKLNSFIFASKSQKMEQKDKVSYRMFNYAISKLQPRFSLPSCTYGISRDKQNTIRNQLYQMGIPHCYTLENSFYGYNTGGKIKHYTQMDFFEIGKSTVLAIYALVSSNQKMQREACLKKFGFNRETLTQELSIMADRFERQQNFSLNDKQMLSESDPEGDVLNVEERLNVIKDTSKALSKKVKQSFSATAAVGFNFSKSRKTKKNKLNIKGNSKRTNSKLLFPPKEQIISTSCPSNLQMDKDSEQQEQKKEQKNIKDQLNLKSQNNFTKEIGEKRDSKYMNFKKMTTRKKQSKNDKNELGETAYDDIDKSATQIKTKNQMNKTFQKFEERFNNNQQIHTFYEKVNKKYSRHSKIKTEASFLNQQKTKNQQIPIFSTEPLAGNAQNRHKREGSRSKINGQNVITKNQFDNKYKMLKQESLRALLTDSLSILKIDPVRKGTNPVRQQQRQKGKSYSGYRMQSHNNKNTNGKEFIRSLQCQQDSRSKRFVNNKKQARRSVKIRAK